MTAVPSAVDTSDQAHDPEQLSLRLEQVAGTLVELTRRGHGKKLMMPIMECVKELRVVWSALRTFALVHDASRIQVMQEREQELRKAMDILNGTMTHLSATNDRAAETVGEQLHELDELENADDSNFIATRLRCVTGTVRDAASEMQTDILRSRSDLSTSEKIIAAVDRKLAEAQRQIMQDSLTRVLSRVAFEQRVNELAGQSNVVTGTWCVALVDIDHLSQINDAHGRRVGDALLFRVAELIQHTCDTYPGAMVGRFGGEEFGVLLPRCSLREGRHMAEEIRTAIANAKWECKTGARPSVLSATVSIGLGEFRNGESANQFLRRVGAHLDSAKRTGRNTVVAEG